MKFGHVCSNNIIGLFRLLNLGLIRICFRSEPSALPLKNCKRSKTYLTSSISSSIAATSLRSFSVLSISKVDVNEQTVVPFGLGVYFLLQVRLKSSLCLAVYVSNHLEADEKDD